MTGRGGWPMTVFLTPDGVPFYGGTYFPPDGPPGHARLRRVLLPPSPTPIKNKRERRRQARPAAARAQLSALPATCAPGRQLLTAERPATARSSAIAAQRTTTTTAASAARPSSPNAMTLDFLLRYHKRTGARDALAMAEMHPAQDGRGRHVRPGRRRLPPLFHRRRLAGAPLREDALRQRPPGPRLPRRLQRHRQRLLPPHLRGDPGLRPARDDRRRRRLLLHPGRRLRGRRRASSSSGRRPSCATSWARTPSVIGALLRRHATAATSRASNILNVPMPAGELRRSATALDAAEFEAKLREPRSQALRSARAARAPRPRREGADGLERPDAARLRRSRAWPSTTPRYREAAVRNADFLLDDDASPDGRLLRTWKARRSGPASTATSRTTPAWPTASSRLYQATFEPTLPAQRRIELADEMIDLFWDERGAGLLRHRPRPREPDHPPSRPLRQRHALRQLRRRRRPPAPRPAHATHPDYEERAVACLRALAPVIERAATGFGAPAAALDFHLSTPQELALVWPEAQSRAP